MPDQDPFAPARVAPPGEAVCEMVILQVIPEDERVWVEHRDGVWTHPLCLNVSNGYWTELLRVRKSGVLHRHRHPNPVDGLVLKRCWHYLEHDWVAEEGAYVSSRRARPTRSPCRKTSTR